MKRVVSVFCVLTALLIFPVAGQASGIDSQADEFNLEDYTFDGEFMFDLNSMYTINGIGQPLNVRGKLDVFFNGEDQSIGTLDLWGYKSGRLDDEGLWDGTFAGDWVYDPAGCDFCDHTRGLFDDLSLFEQHLEVTFSSEFNEELGLPEGNFILAGTINDDGEFEGSAVPIPASVLLLGTGMVGLLGLRRKKLA